jgi:hypothetical protein
MTRVEVSNQLSFLSLFRSFFAMADDFDAAASWLSSNPSAASLPNDTKLEVCPCLARGVEQG